MTGKTQEVKNPGLERLCHNWPKAVIPGEFHIVGFDPESRYYHVIRLLLDPGSRFTTLHLAGMTYCDAVSEDQAFIL